LQHEPSVPVTEQALNGPRNVRRAPGIDEGGSHSRTPSVNSSA
jgi:hypothetical protein